MDFILINVLKQHWKCSFSFLTWVLLWTTTHLYSCHRYIQKSSSHNCIFTKAAVHWFLLTDAIEFQAVWVDSGDKISVVILHTHKKKDKWQRRVITEEDWENGQKRKGCRVCGCAYECVSASCSFFLLLLVSCNRLKRLFIAGELRASHSLSVHVVMWEWGCSSEKQLKPSRF